MSDTLFCPSCESQNVIGMEIRGVYDGVLYWQCDQCDHRWHRWTQGRLHHKAAKYVEGKASP